MTTNKGVSKVAVEIGSRFGETGERPLRQIDRMVRLMGEEWVQNVADEAEADQEQPDHGLRYLKDGARRTAGGLFFALARSYARASLANGNITRRDFYRAFFDKAPEPRAKKAPPPRPAPPPRTTRKMVPPPQPTGGARASSGNVRTHDRRRAPMPQVEVYAVRRPAR